ncbi:MAG: transglutaminase family protein [Desulfosarcina sp.]|nr:transglutaminase family protein [Desulfosarcina sp.]
MLHRTYYNFSGTVKQKLSGGTVSCRDFAALFMVAARCLGFAARCVSGYLHAPPSTDSLGATHAWTEVYLPGAGWKGFDPTIGKIAGTDHFAVAVARLPESVPPIAGSFVGPSSLDVGVWITMWE